MFNQSRKTIISSRKCLCWFTKKGVFCSVLIDVKRFFFNDFYLTHEKRFLFSITDRESPSGFQFSPIKPFDVRGHGVGEGCTAMAKGFFLFSPGLDDKESVRFGGGRGWGGWRESGFAGQLCEIACPLPAAGLCPGPLIKT